MADSTTLEKAHSNRLYTTAALILVATVTTTSVSLLSNRIRPKVIQYPLGKFDS